MTPAVRPYSSGANSPATGSTWRNPANGPASSRARGWLSVQAVGQRLDPLGPAGVRAGQHEIASSEALDRGRDDRPAVDVDGRQAVGEVVGQALAVQVQ